MSPIENTAACARCGTCCRKGGPALHVEDRPLVEQGLIHTRHLFTIRAGEIVEDPIRGKLTEADGDLIKIKGSGGSWSCCLFDPDAGACRVYAHRPIECRALSCRDSRGIEAAFARPRLTRRDLLAGIEGLWELVDAHQQRCDHRHVRRLLAGRGAKTQGAGRLEIEEILRFDEEIRRLVVSRGGLQADMTDFLFGRPLRATLAALRRAGVIAPGKTHRVP